MSLIAGRTVTCYEIQPRHANLRASTGCRAKMAEPWLNSSILQEPTLNPAYHWLNKRFLMRESTHQDEDTNPVANES